MSQKYGIVWIMKTLSFFHVAIVFVNDKSHKTYFFDMSKHEAVEILKNFNLVGKQLSCCELK